MRPMIAALSVLTVALPTGCTTSHMVTFQVESEPAGARIEVNGLDRGVTPTNVQLEALKTWSPFSPGGWNTRSTAYEVVAYPPASSSNSSRQSKRIDMKQTVNGGKIFFDFTWVEPQAK